MTLDLDHVLEQMDARALPFVEAMEAEIAEQEYEDSGFLNKALDKAADYAWYVTVGMIVAIVGIFGMIFFLATLEE